MKEPFFQELLGVEPGASKVEIRKAFHRLARENHPDLFPPQQKEIQELRMMALNEAYSFLMAEQAPGPWAGPEVQPQSGPQATRRRALGFHKEPAYAYYKQGFLHFSRALQGIAALYESVAQRKSSSFLPRHQSYQRFAGGLDQLREAHIYFLRVAQDFPDSIWAVDAGLKLERIGRFTELYRRILVNLRRPGP